MPAQRHDPFDEWSPGAAIAAAAAVGQFAWSLAALTGSVPTARVALYAAVLVGVGTMVILARCRMPLAIKGALMVVLLASLMLLFAAKDLAGLRQMVRAADPVLAGTPAPAPPRVTVSGGFDPDTGHAATVVAGRLDAAGGGVGVELRADGAGGIGWRVRRGTAERWCGTYREADPAATGAYQALAERAAQAAAASRDGPLDCG